MHTTSRYHWGMAAAALCLVLPLTGSAQTIVSLGAGASYAIFAGTGITSTGLTVVNGDVGLSPIGPISGFAAISPGGLGIVNGGIHDGDSSALAAASAFSSAYQFAAAESPTGVDLASLSNTVLTPGVYHAAASLSVSGIITLDGQGLANPVFFFQSGTSLSLAAGSQIVLLNGATAADIFWVSGTSVTLGAGALIDGTVLAGSSVSLDSGVQVDGRLWATSTVTLADDMISAVPEPAETSVVMGGVAGLWAMWQARRRRNLV
jgi:hypothetical protein